ncbi:MAG: DUF2974 domain-containing protein [Syntrophomonas sp.]|nr:DUF2974 domain-containing protein [Syntrophomonas sp.]
MVTFDVKWFNPVDSLVLSQFAYVDFKQLVPDIANAGIPVRIGDLLKAEMFSSMFNNIRDAESNRRLLFALAASPRFRNIKLNYYINRIDPQQEKQFSAVTYLLDDKTMYIAYRGTDTTLIGWKEDFNMAFASPIPAQEEGVKYLNATAKLIPGMIIIGGHSKGGNIAVYSAIQCQPSVQDRIINIFNHDGPGFRDYIFNNPGFPKIKDRIHKTLPQSSVVGMLFQDKVNYFVVKSNRIGFMQHDPFSWSIGDDDFCYARNISSSSMHMHKTLNHWLSTLTDDKRELFVATFYQIIEKTNAVTVFDFSEDWQRKAMSILEAIKSIDAETKDFVVRAINDLVKLSFKSRRNDSN